MGLTGGCFCGAVRYEAGGEPFEPTLCHCSDCRRAAGAPAMAWFSVRPEAFRITAGTPKLLRSSPGVTRRFCGDCGTGLTYRHDALNEIDVTVCSLDDPELVPPADESWTSERLSWMRPGHPRPEYFRFREG